MESVSTVTWTPTYPEQSNLAKFAEWAQQNGAPELTNYHSIHAWSVAQTHEFWNAVRLYAGVRGAGFEHAEVTSAGIHGRKAWFAGANVNFAENILRFAEDPKLANVPAITNVLESGETKDVTWAALVEQVGALSHTLRELGVKPGDRVVAVLPNVAETIVAMLATATVGAIWSVCSPDLSAGSIISRFNQLEPVIMFAGVGYQYKGAWQNKSDQLREVQAALPTLKQVILVEHVAQPSQQATMHAATLFADAIAHPELPVYEQTPFEHPLWVLFSSGTTGAPKGIVHGHGGMLLEAIKTFGLTQGIGTGTKYFVAANTSWMVWNTLLHALASGASVLCYSGSPTYQGVDCLFSIVAKHHITMFATGAAYLELVMRSGESPKEKFNFSSLEIIRSTGSTLSEAAWLWVHSDVKEQVHLGSDSGGTDICSSIIGSNPLQPVHVGLLQGPMLGLDVQAWNDNGKRVVNEVGELVIVNSSPAMPVKFWGDHDGEKYHAAYYDRFPQVWAHGDWITELSSGEFIVHGRSDATLNRDGVRLGSSEIYGALAFVPEISNSLCVGLDLPNGEYFQPLFVALAGEFVLDDSIRNAITTHIKKHASARHIPDEIIQVPDIPLTHAGKKIEVPIKRVLQGADPSSAMDRGALVNPDAVDWFIEYATAMKRT